MTKFCVPDYPLAGINTWKRIERNRILNCLKNSLIAEKGYFACYDAVMALLLDSDLKPTTHNGAKSNFSEYFIATNKISKEFGKIYSQLFTWRQKGDYDDLFDFDSKKVMPYFAPVETLINTIVELFEKIIAGPYGQELLLIYGAGWANNPSSQKLLKNLMAEHLHDLKPKDWLFEKAGRQQKGQGFTEEYTCTCYVIVLPLIEWKTGKIFLYCSSS